MNKIIINTKTREKRMAVWENNELTRLHIEQPNQQSKVGNIYLGKVTAIKSSLNAAFVDFGEEKTGFLQKDNIPSYVNSQSKQKHLMSISSFIHEGQKLLVQVKKDETQTKGAVLTGLLEMSTQDLVYMPFGHYVGVSKKIEESQREQLTIWANDMISEEEGMIIRTSASTKTANQISEQFQSVQQDYKRWINNNDRTVGIVKQHDSFWGNITEDVLRLKHGNMYVDDVSTVQMLKKETSTNDWQIDLLRTNSRENALIDQAVEEVLDKTVRLDNGAYVVIDETEALVTIDVNSGKFTNKHHKAQMIRETNIAAAKAIANQIILRNLSGIILIDFIDMKDERHKQEVRQAFAHAMKNDQKNFRVVGFSSLNILQLTRKKTQNSVRDALQTTCVYCKGTGKVKTAETLAFQLERELWEYVHTDYEAVLLEASHSLADVFCGKDAIHLKRLEHALGFRILIQQSAHEHPYYHLAQFGKLEDLSAKLQKND